MLGPESFLENEIQDSRIFCITNGPLRKKEGFFTETQTRNLILDKSRDQVSTKKKKSPGTLEDSTMRVLLYIHDHYTYTYACRNIFNTIRTSEDTSLEKYTSHFI